MDSVKDKEQKASSQCLYVDKVKKDDRKGRSRKMDNLLRLLVVPWLSMEDYYVRNSLQSALLDVLARWKSTDKPCKGDGRSFVPVHLKHLSGN